MAGLYAKNAWLRIHKPDVYYATELTEYEQSGVWKWELRWSAWLVVCFQTARSSLVHKTNALQRDSLTDRFKHSHTIPAGIRARRVSGSSRCSSVRIRSISHQPHRNFRKPLLAVLDRDVRRVRHGFDPPVLGRRGQRCWSSADCEVAGAATIPKKHIRFAVVGKPRAPGKAIETWNVVMQ